MILSLILITIGYLMGSICSAILVCRAFNLPDPREEGSKNPGATNVLRIAGKHYAALVMLGDILKGTIPVLLAKLLGAGPITQGFTALAAVVGHIYPVFFEFKGGKGVATAIGALLGLQFMVGVLVAATWLIVANFSHYSSLASIVSIALSLFYVLIITQHLNLFPPLFFMVLLIIYKHRENITRLIDGTEPKIKLKRNMLKDIVEPPATPPSAHEENTLLAEQVAAEEATKAKKVKKPKSEKKTNPK